MDGYINGWMDERIEDPKKALLIKAFLEDESVFSSSKHCQCVVVNW